MTFEQFVTTYLNKRNPENNMYWMMSDIPGDPARLKQYLDFAREVNYQYVMQYGVSAKDSYLIAAWNQAATV